MIDGLIQLFTQKKPKLTERWVQKDIFAVRMSEKRSCLMKCDDADVWFLICAASTNLCNLVTSAPYEFIAIIAIG